MGVAKGIEEDRPRIGAHRPGAGLPIGDPLNDLALPIGRRRGPGNRQCPRARFRLPMVRQLDLNCRAADRDAINQVANVSLGVGAA
jgi:hypothetical protein